MAGGAGPGGRRSLDAELNTIPMIDLMMVTISFLLITAVWSQMARLDASARAPSDQGEPPACEPHCDHRALHVEMEKERFRLAWKDGARTIGAVEDVPRHDVVSRDGETRVVRYPELGERMRAAWQGEGAHRAATDPAKDRVVLHVDDETSYAELVGAMDAIAAVKKGAKKGSNEREDANAFELTFAAR